MTTPASAHPDDPHYVHRTGWLRAAVLGANDGIISTASLVVEVAAGALTGWQRLEGPEWVEAV